MSLQVASLELVWGRGFVIRESRVAVSESWLVNELIVTRELPVSQTGRNHSAWWSISSHQVRNEMIRLIKADLKGKEDTLGLKCPLARATESRAHPPQGADAVALKILD
jgi:hypothetical protein